MASSIAQQDRDRHRELPDTASGMAKAHIRKTDVEWRRAVGRTVEAVRRSRGWTLDEFAGKLNKDARQVGRWEKGEERPQFDVILALDECRWPLLLVFAELMGVEIETHIRIRRTA